MAGIIFAEFCLVSDETAGRIRVELGLFYFSSVRTLDLITIQKQNKRQFI
jgi:hypothetical protein